VIHHVVYEQLPAIARSAYRTPWISIHFGSLDTMKTFTSGGGVLTSLQLLANRGDQVSDLGSTTLSGATVHEYQVVITPSALRRQVADAHFPAWMRSTTLHVFSGALTEDVYVGHDGLLRELSATFSIEAAGQRGSVVVTVALSDYGVHTSITAPPKSQVTDITPNLDTVPTSPV
jgi:hypothetical protein